MAFYPPNYTPNPNADGYWPYMRSSNDHPDTGTDHVNPPGAPPFPFAFAAREFPGPRVPWGPRGAGAATGRGRGPWPCGGPWLWGGDGSDRPYHHHRHGPRGPWCNRHNRRHREGEECYSDDDDDGSHTPLTASPDTDAHMEEVEVSDEKQRGESAEGGEKESTVVGDDEKKEKEKKPHEHPPGPGPHHGGPHNHRGHSHEHGGPPFGGPFGGGPYGVGPFGGFRGGRRGGFGGNHGRHHSGPGGGPGGRTSHPQLEAWLEGLGSHPLVHQIRVLLESLNITPSENESRDNNNNDNGENDDVESFTPPVDIFETEAGPGGAWIVHVAVPGAKKEDVGVHWQAEQGVLAVSGVVYRPGDETLQRGLVSSERKVGLFKREVRLPPSSRRAGGANNGNNGGGHKEVIDDNGITARLEDGLLMVTVPRVEKEWTEVRKVDIM